MTYKQQLQEKKNPENQEKLNFKVEQAKLQAQADLLAVRQQLALAQKQLHEERSSENYSLTGVVEMLMQVKHFSTVVETMEKEFATAFPAE